MTASPLLVRFDDGDRTMADLLGGKGANLAEMTRMGLPVPHGFTITTQACREYLAKGQVPAELAALVTSAMADLETATGQTFGAGDDPLLVSVRSGARFSMPGMMDTILNVGLTDSSVQALAARGGERFAWDCYRRLVQMYGRTMLGAEAAHLDAAVADACAGAGVADPTALSVGRLMDLVTHQRQVLKEQTGHDLPQDPHDQLRRSVEAVFESWNSPRARLYRAHEGIPEDLGTAVNVVQMVYGNTGPRSGSGVCFTRDPATGSPVPYGDYLQNAQGEDVVNGSRQTVPLAALEALEPTAFDQLMSHLAGLERHYRDLCDVEFTIEDGALWILQTRVGKRSPAAAFVIAADLARHEVITMDEALARVDGHQLESLLHDQFDDQDGLPWVAAGLPASPGASVGEAVFDSDSAVSAAAEGRAVVLVRAETSAEDLPGILASCAVVTARGGLASHAAVVARGFGRTCVTGVEGMAVDEAARQAHLPSGVVIHQGDVLSVDGTTGKLYAGPLPIRPSSVAAALADPSDEAPDAVVARLVGSVRQILAQADSRARLKVLANAETGPQAAQARRLGAQGIGLCRTEHMLLGSRRHLVERVIVGDDRPGALLEIERIAVDELTQILRAMDGLPVVVRLLDPPLHEFLPDCEDLAVQAALEASAGRVDPGLRARLETARRWHQVNPMLGLRGVRLLTVLPELVDVHVRALVAATHGLRADGFDPRPEIMVPLVADPAELAAARTRIRQHLEVPGASGATVPMPIGVMVELPRAALRAGELARLADFFSFGTNDLTQTTWGMSRDDAQTSFLSAYRSSGLLERDPFESIDEEGVGELVQLAIERGRHTKADIGLGVCGEHAGDPGSIHFFARAGVDYVSCSPPRVVIARLEAGRAEVLGGRATTDDTR
ncbi:pyruvate, phosphate dikinase [Pedococcus sp.]|uniref:pyruvate, phosphate dikinase n=1 Tax=Pedococcus sp. TaxID=2860345 RepID=UPI002E11CF60|nr:pyruvate, phosphate dikinase [Pedococcus sp.]